VTTDPAMAMAAATDWDSLVGLLRTCVACEELVAGRTQVVPGQRPPGADVLLVGEAPGAQEDETGIPFVGRSGQLLDQLLGDAGLDRTRVAVVNVIKCRPPGNRTPRRGEVARCRPWLQRQIELVDPTVVVALGSTAAAWFFGPGARIAALRERGRDEPLWYAGRRLVVTYHPSAAIRFGPNGEPVAALRADLTEVVRLLGAARGAP
jgi:uracil-DNA glycosylase